MTPGDGCAGVGAGEGAGAHGVEEPLDPGMRPPFGRAPGLPVDDEAVIAAFALGQEGGHSPRFYAEGPVLMIDGDIPGAIRAAPGTVLVNMELPEDMAGDRPVIETALTSAGLSLLDEETLWGMPVALQLAGLRIGRFDLWGLDLEASFAAVRVVAIGDESAPMF